MENREYLDNINNTGEFVERDYKHAYASFGLRAFAFIIDMIVVGAINNIIRGFNLIDPDIMIYNISLINILSGLVTVAYFTIASLITKGQSLGKIITGLRVVSLSSDKLSVSQILIREICGRFIQNKLFLLYILPIFTPKNQGLIDFFVDTAVVKEDAVYDLYGKEF